MQTPQSAREFVEFMMSVWDGENHHLYDTHNNAYATARFFGYKRLWGNHLDGEPGVVFEMPDGSRVIMATHGAAIREVDKGRRGRKPHL